VSELKGAPESDEQILTKKVIQWVE
jgi:hypothetical protein